MKKIIFSLFVLSVVLLAASLVQAQKEVPPRVYGDYGSGFKRSSSGKGGLDINGRGFLHSFFSNFLNKGNKNNEKDCECDVC